MYQIENHRHEGCTCDRCGRSMPVNSYEYQEHLCIDYHAGYESVFGDGNIVEGQFCQHCILACLGEWLRVREVPERAPKGAYQAHQRPPKRGISLLSKYDTDEGVGHTNNDNHTDFD